MLIKYNYSPIVAYEMILNFKGIDDYEFSY